MNTRTQIVFAGALLLLVFGLAGWAVLKGRLWFNLPSQSDYPVRGIDVSHHQGIVDWKAVAGSGISFAYIKATEGADFRDRQFLTNWRSSREAGLHRGAYHFFTLCRPGADQARNFIAFVPRADSMLPPVADLEFIGNCSGRPPALDTAREISDFLAIVDQWSGTRTIIYTTYEFHDRYLRAAPLNRSIWIRDVFSTPKPPFTETFIFWQYSMFGRVPGIQGRVDLNVFRGTVEDFKEWTQKLGESPKLPRRKRTKTSLGLQSPGIET